MVAIRVFQVLICRWDAGETRASGGKPFVKTYVNRKRFTVRVFYENIGLERKLSIRIVEKVAILQ